MDTYKINNISNSPLTDIKNVMLTEPRIVSIRNELLALMEIINFEKNNEAIDITYFRLRNIEQWADYPTSISEIFWSLSSLCNFNCEFCYEKGNPSDCLMKKTYRKMSKLEIDTRLKYYDTQKGLGIFPIRGAINEPFHNKNALYCLKKMREKTSNELITFVTNGSLLDQKTIDELKKISPVFFNLSIYSCDPMVRKKVLKDNRKDINAVKAIEYMNKIELPYSSNIIMWPSISLEDMRKTLDFLDKNKCTIARVCLGAYSRYLKHPYQNFEIYKYWENVIDEVNRIKKNYRIPILIEPNSYVEKDNVPRIAGVIYGSPAFQYHLRSDDEILAINNVTMHSKMQLISSLKKLSQSQKKVVLRLKIKRDNIIIPIDMDISNIEYPYKQISKYNDFPFGFVITDTLKYKTLIDVRNIIKKYSKQKALIITSKLMKPILNYMVEKSKVFNYISYDIIAAKNNYFGGTITAGDLLVARDFIDCIKKYLDKYPNTIDLIIIPESPFYISQWKKDLRGEPITVIERETGIPVKPVECTRIIN